MLTSLLFHHWEMIKNGLPGDLFRVWLICDVTIECNLYSTIILYINTYVFVSGDHFDPFPDWSSFFCRAQYAGLPFFINISCESVGCKRKEKTKEGKNTSRATQPQPQ